MLIDLLQAHDDAARLIENGHKHRDRVLWIQAFFRRNMFDDRTREGVMIRYRKLWFPAVTRLAWRQILNMPQKVCRRIDPARYQSCASGPLFPVEPK